MIRIRQLNFQYPDGNYQLVIPSLDIESGERVAVIGPSGSGKTTLLKLMAGILHPDRGYISVEGIPLDELSEGQRRNFRITRIGFIFQALELLEYLNVEDNILHCFRINPSLRLGHETRARAFELAVRMGLGEKYHRLPGCLSQGERQRVALCRALLPGPSLILADEATGNLDPSGKQLVVDALIEACESSGCSLVAVTHDHEILSRFDRVIDFDALRAVK